MDPHGLNPPPQNGSNEWLPHYILEALHAILPQIGQMASDVRSLAHNQAHNRRDILDQMHRGLDSLKADLSHLRDRMASIEESHRQSPSEARSGLVNSLFGSVGGWIVSHLPWKHALIMGLGAAGALLGHVMPDRVRNAGAGFVKILTDLFSG